jgi:hypothetical protein
VKLQTSTFVFLGALALGVLDCGVQPVNLITDPVELPPDGGIDPDIDSGVEPDKNYCVEAGFGCVSRTLGGCQALGFVTIFELACLDQDAECCMPPPPPPPPSECENIGGFCVPRDVMNGECAGEPLYLDFTISCEVDREMPSGNVCCRWRDQLPCEQKGYGCFLPDKMTGGCPTNLMQVPNECPQTEMGFTICCAPK